ncbi:hypothetical protein KR009_003497 [Drosophila setifemur]|nr:hypothetical protein KR009_003497 [Drosophila setifemur]
MNRVRTTQAKTGEIIAYSEGAIRNNISAVEYCRTSMAAISGCAAGNLTQFMFNQIMKHPRFLGILGLSGTLGFLFYFLSVFVLWILVLAKSGTQWRKFFINRRNLLTNQFMGGLCTYVLFWTFLYGMVHVY